MFLQLKEDTLKNSSIKVQISYIYTTDGQWRAKQTRAQIPLYITFVCCQIQGFRLNVVLHSPKGASTKCVEKVQSCKTLSMVTTMLTLDTC